MYLLRMTYQYAFRSARQQVLRLSVSIRPSCENSKINFPFWMATAFGLSLGSVSQEWAEVYQLQSESRFVEALKRLKSAPRSDPKTKLYSSLLQLNLEMCIAASSGVHPNGADYDALESVYTACRDAGFMDVAIETQLLMFDSFPSHREQILSALVDSSMDEHTKRRVYHRKGQHLVASGHFYDAQDLWLPLVTASGIDPEDADDSLASLLLDFGRLYSHLGKFNEAVDIYNHCLCVSRSLPNQAVSLIRLSNALERISRPAQADKRRQEYFHMISKPYPTLCAMCSVVLGKEPKFLIPCCKTVVHSECLRAVVSEYAEDENKCPFCETQFIIGEVVDPTAVTGRKYKKKSSGRERANSVTDDEIKPE
jgi:tetratricopeptide (TPR) repeat protein